MLTTRKTCELQSMTLCIKGDLAWLYNANTRFTAKHFDKACFTAGSWMLTGFVSCCLMPLWVLKPGKVPWNIAIYKGRFVNLKITK